MRAISRRVRALESEHGDYLTLGELLDDLDSQRSRQDKLWHPRIVDGLRQLVDAE